MIDPFVSVPRWVGITVFVFPVCRVRSHVNSLKVSTNRTMFEPRPDRDRQRSIYPTTVSRTSMYVTVREMGQKWACPPGCHVSVAAVTTAELFNLEMNAIFIYFFSVWRWFKTRGGCWSRDEDNEMLCSFFFFFSFGIEPISDWCIVLTLPYTGF